jgi:hypothetical protein
MPAAADRRDHSNFSGGSDYALDIAHIRASRYQTRLAIEHAVPDGTCAFVSIVIGAQQVTFELPAKRRIDLSAGFDHLSDLL